jgi:DNA polymerase V
MLYALLDCNNFYASCERTFNPRLENKPIVVLSNNDGCIISRSNEAKKLKIPMGAPYFEWKSFCEKHGVHVFSSNYELYGDMSQRVMTLIKEFNEDTEIYSIDEAFLLLPSSIQFSELVNLRKNIFKSTGIPISIGISQTKTLAKMANQIAKQSSAGVFFLKETNLEAFRNFPVEKIWGVGKRISAKLNNLKIDTAEKLRDADPKMIRMHFNVTLEKTVNELNGIPCLELETLQPRKQIISSRSFGKLITTLTDLEEAISYYMHSAALKLRKQKSTASAVGVFIQTNRFNSNHSQYGNSITFPLPYPTADTRYLISAAKKCLHTIYKEKYQYHKAGVMLLDLSSNEVNQLDLLQNVIDEKSKNIMRMLDTINLNMGKNCLFLAAQGIQRSWLLKFKRRSPRYTTRWDEIPKVD